MDPTPTPQDVLRGVLEVSHRIASRLAWSSGRVAVFMPLSIASLAGLKDEEVERLDAFLLRYASLTGAVQDQVTKALLRLEEEDLSDKTRKDQRLLLEKAGALDPAMEFGNIAELRNRLAHVYPDDPEKQAAILNETYKRALDLIQVFNDLVTYADVKFFASTLRLTNVTVPASRA